MEWKYIGYIKYRGYYALIESAGVSYKISIYNDNDDWLTYESCSFDEAKLKAFLLIDEYLECSSEDLVRYASPYPENSQIPIDNYNRKSQKSYKFMSVDSISLYNSFVKCGFESTLKLIFSGIDLCDYYTNYIFNITKIIKPVSDIVVNDRVVLVDGFFKNYTVVFDPDDLYGIFDVTQGFRQSLLKIKYNSGLLKYERQYSFNLYIDGIIVDTGSVTFKNNSEGESCEFKGCSRVFGEKGLFLYTVCLKDYENVAECLHSVYVGHNDAFYELLKYSAACFFRYSVNCYADSNKVNNFLKKYENINLNRFLDNVHFRIEDWKTVSYEDFDFDNYVCYSHLNKRKKRGSDDFDLVNVQDDIVSDHLFSIKRRSLSSCSEIVPVRYSNSSDDDLIKSYLICWKHLSTKESQNEVLFEIVMMVMTERFDYKTICQRIIDKFGIELINQLFQKSVRSDMASISHRPSHFISNRLADINEISSKNNIPRIFRRKKIVKIKL
jgi:hypothetical protein